MRRRYPVCPHCGRRHAWFALPLGLLALLLWLWAQPAVAGSNHEDRQTKALESIARSLKACKP